jgi:hypothetical protein
MRSLDPTVIGSPSYHYPIHYIGVVRRCQAARLLLEYDRSVRWRMPGSVKGDRD